MTNLQKARLSALRKNVQINKVTWRCAVATFEGQQYCMGDHRDFGRWRTGPDGDIDGEIPEAVHGALWDALDAFYADQKC